MFCTPQVVRMWAHQALHVASIVLRPRDGTLEDSDR